MGVDHKNKQGRSEVWIPNGPFPLNNGPVVKLYDVVK